MHTDVVGIRERRELREMAGEAQVARGRELRRALCKPCRTPGELRDLASDRAFGSRLEGRRIAVPPSAVEAPDTADDELGLVVDGPEIRTFEQVFRRANRVHDVVEARAIVHECEGLLEQRLEQLRGVEERALHPVGADDGQPVARQEHLGVEGGHRSHCDGPVGRVPLHLLRVAAVG